MSGHRGKPDGQMKGMSALIQRVYPREAQDFPGAPQRRVSPAANGLKALKVEIRLKAFWK
jgi:hypothetical protein